MKQFTIRSRYNSCLLFIFVVAFSLVCLNSSKCYSQKKQEGSTSFFLSGDALMSLPWSQYKEPEFTGLIDEVRQATVAITNLEMLIHNYEGYPQASSGGTYMTAEPLIVQELAWAGFDMVGNANNHTFDYGSIAVLKTIEHTQNAGLRIAGAGKDLQMARAAVYYESSAGTIALLSTSSSFTDYGKASPSRPDMHGRPGLNPLSVERTYTIDLETAEKLREIASEAGIRTRPSRNGRINIFGRNFIIGDKSGNSYVMDEDDLKGNLEAVREAARKADWVVMSIHAHQSAPNNAPPDFLKSFARQCIDNGADIVFGHGPHYVKGVEIYKGRPIFYSLGNLVFQNETIKKQPYEFYARYGLGDDATVDEAYDARTTTDRGVDTRSFPAQRHNWESVVAVADFKDGKIERIRLLPITLGQGKKRGERGRPLFADNELGKYLINQMIERSKPMGTDVKYIESENIGIVELSNK